MSAAPPITPLVLTTVMASCGKPVDKNIQKTFAAPEDAGAAFLEAAKSGDAGTLVAIFGPAARSAAISAQARPANNSRMQGKFIYEEMPLGCIPFHDEAERRHGRLCPSMEKKGQAYRPDSGARESMTR
jgi:hypothetical protein